MDKNTNNYANKSRDDIRRKDYAVTDPQWIKSVLHRGRYGVLATTHERQPYATPINYVYREEDQTLYFHGAKVGRTRANIALNPQVCFNVAEMGDLIPGDRISSFGVDYNSVTVFGIARLVTDQDKILTVLLDLMLKYFPEHKPGVDYPLPEPDELKRTAVYAIQIESWTAKKQDSG